MTQTDSPAFVVVATYWHPNDAAAFLSVLKSEDIDARLLDDNLSSMRSGIEMFAGGTKVVVPDFDAERARDILREVEPERMEESEEPIAPSDLNRARIERSCPRCESHNITSPHRPAVIGALVFGFFAAAIATGLPMPPVYAAYVAAAVIPAAYLFLMQTSARWRCNDCKTAWKM